MKAYEEVGKTLESYDHVEFDAKEIIAGMGDGILKSGKKKIEDRAFRCQEWRWSLGQAP